MAAWRPKCGNDADPNGKRGGQNGEDSAVHSIATGQTGVCGSSLCSLERASRERGSHFVCPPTLEGSPIIGSYRHFRLEMASSCRRNVNSRQLAVGCCVTLRLVLQFNTVSTLYVPYVRTVRFEVCASKSMNPSAPDRVVSSNPHVG